MTANRRNRRPPNPAVLGIGLWALLLPGAVQPVADVSLEVKFAFLYNFAKFVTWPAEVLAPQDPITLCVGVEPSVSADLVAIANGRQVAGHPLQIRRIEEVSDLTGCHILYLDQRYRSDARELEAVAGASVLTVGESRGFSRGGIIGFFWVDNKLRFEINVDAAHRARLELSARLLALAKVVHDE